MVGEGRRAPIKGPSNKALHQTRRGGVAASRPVVEARLAGEGWCSTGHLDLVLTHKAKSSA